MKIAEIAAQLQPELVELRRDFHQYPEPSGKEKRTAARIAEELTKHKISVERKAGTGVVGTLTGSQPGPTVALRADIDALSIEEKPERVMLQRIRVLCMPVVMMPILLVCWVQLRS